MFSDLNINLFLMLCVSTFNASVKMNVFQKWISVTFRLTNGVLTFKNAFCFFFLLLIISIYETKMNKNYNKNNNFWLKLSRNYDQYKWEFIIKRFYKNKWDYN